MVRIYVDFQVGILFSFERALVTLEPFNVVVIQMAAFYVDV